MRTVTIIGPGRAGGAIAIALNLAGVFIDRLVFRNRPVDLRGVDAPQVPFSACDELASQVLIIATADPEIRPVAEKIAKFDVLPKVALHLSGSLSSAELESLKSRGVAIGSMHPLVSISEADVGARRLKDSYFCVEGDTAAVEASKELVHSLGGIPFTIDSSFKPLYHAAAVTASGNVTALFDTAIEMLGVCGIDRSQAQSVLHPLLASAVANLVEGTTEAALTGPYARGDISALVRHLQAFEGNIEIDLQRIYLLLAGRSVEMMARSEPGHMAALAEAISIAKQKIGC